MRTFFKLRRLLGSNTQAQEPLVLANTGSLWYIERAPICYCLRALYKYR